MLLERYGATLTVDGVTFMVGGRVHAKDNDEYGGLDGVILEIHTDEDKETENEGPEICCVFDVPDDPELVAEIEARFSDLYQQPKTIDDIGLDYVIMLPDTLEVLDQDEVQSENPSFRPSL